MPFPRRSRPFGDLEAAVMDLIWRSQRPVLVRDVVEQIQPERPLAYTTVMTVMDNLHRKGFLSREMVGRAWRYTPSASREVYTARLMRDALDSSDDQTAALAHFVAGMSAAESDTLRWLLRRRPGTPR